MSYPVIKDDSFSSIVRMLRGEKPTLAEQHLGYVLMVEDNRAVMTQHAMTNTAILMEYAEGIIYENPRVAGALAEIMEAYLTATSDQIQHYGERR